MVAPQCVFVHYAHNMAGQRGRSLEAMGIRRRGRFAQVGGLAMIDGALV